jgi:hypothetical protein
MTSISVKDEIEFISREINKSKLERADDGSRNISYMSEVLDLWQDEVTCLAPKVSKNG